VPAHIERTGVGNIRCSPTMRALVMAALPDRSLARVFVLFPDPWPKTRHHKRRFVQRATLDRLADADDPGAELRLATDDPSYLPWMIEHACTHPAFDWLAEGPADWRGRPADWPGTRYETKRSRARRHSCWLRRRLGLTRLGRSSTGLGCISKPGMRIFFDGSRVRSHILRCSSLGCQAAGERREEGE
jgi:tRNA (guanine-N7-)-methyltransferase